MAFIPIAVLALRLLPNLKNIFYVLARKPLRRFLIRKLKVQLTYAIRLINPTTSRAIASRLARKVKRKTLSKRARRRLYRFARTIRKQLKKPTAAKSFKALVDNYTKVPKRKELQLGVITDVVGTALTLSAISKTETSKKFDRAVGRLNQRLERLEAKRDSIKKNFTLEGQLGQLKQRRIKKVPTKSSGGPIWIPQHVRAGVTVKGHWRQR